MRLLAELLGAQDIQLAHLAGKSLGVREALGEEHNLGDKSVVRHHHRYGTEAHLSHGGKTDKGISFLLYFNSPPTPPPQRKISFFFG